MIVGTDSVIVERFELQTQLNWNRKCQEVNLGHGCRDLKSISQYNENKKKKMITDPQDRITAVNIFYHDSLIVTLTVC